MRGSRKFTGKDFRAWGGTLITAIAFAESEIPESEADGKRAVAAQCLEGRAIDDFRPRHLRVLGARDLGLNAEEQALLSLLRSWRIRRARSSVDFQSILR